MDLFSHPNPATITALAALILICVLAMLVSLRRFEVTVALMVLSPWAHWIYAPHRDMDVFAEAVAETGPATYLRATAVAFAGIMGMLYFLRAHSCGKTHIPGPFVLLVFFAFYALLSVVYSIAPVFTLARAAEFLLFLGFLLGLLASVKGADDVERAIKVVAGLAVFGLVANAASAVLLPGRVWWWVAPSRFQGLTSHPNQLGFLCLVSYAFLAWMWPRCRFPGKIALAILLLTAATMHLMSGSRSTMACALAGALLWQLSMGRRGWAITAAVAGTALLIVPTFVAVPSLQRPEEAGLADLTGREEYWINSVHLVAQRPFVGYGYQVSGEVWSDPAFASELLETNWASARTSLHNGYLDVLVGQGFIGLLLFVPIIVWPLWRLAKALPGENKALAVSIVVPILIVNMVETSIAGSRSFSSIIFWVFWALSQCLPQTPARFPSESHRRGISPSLSPRALSAEAGPASPLRKPI